MEKTQEEAPRVLVTGASGYIAPFVLDAFDRHGGWIAYGTDCVESLQVDYLADLTDPEQMSLLLEKTRPDVICHLAAQGNVHKAAADTVGALLAGPVATANLLRCVAALSPATRVVLASTWEVYGHPVLWEPITEMHPRTPETFYAMAKNQQEEIARFYAETQDMDVVTLRLGSAYGPGMRAASVFSIFMDRASKGQPLTVFGEETFRQWTHVRDIAQAFVTVSTRPEAGGVYNVVDDECISTLRLAQTVAQLFRDDKGLPVPITVEEARPGEVTPAEVSSDRMMGLGWMPLEEFSAALLEMAEELRGREEDQ